MALYWWICGVRPAAAVMELRSLMCVNAVCVSHCCPATHLSGRPRVYLSFLHSTHETQRGQMLSNSPLWMFVLCNVCFSLISRFAARTKSLKHKENTRWWVNARKYIYHLELKIHFSSTEFKNLYMLFRALSFDHTDNRDEINLCKLFLIIC